MFYFVVRYLRWLARVPGLPHFFDSLLSAKTCLFNRSRLVAMETFETEALRLPGVRLKVHRFGGIEFVQDNGRELGHLHGHGLLDAAVGLKAASELLAAGQVRRHHIFPSSKWISFQIKSDADVPFAVALLAMAGQVA